VSVLPAIVKQRPFDVAAAHRWFAVEFNNRAWDLVEAPCRSAEESEEMIHAAHAAAIHWKSIGTALNEQRAENLLATAYIKIGAASPALLHARRCLTLSEENRSIESPFDRATALAACSRASAIAGDPAEARKLNLLARELLEKLSDEERTLLRKLYAND
jgi:hypothetical protein